MKLWVCTDNPAKLMIKADKINFVNRGVVVCDSFATPWVNSRIPATNGSNEEIPNDSINGNNNLFNSCVRDMMFNVSETI